MNIMPIPLCSGEMPRTPEEVHRLLTLAAEAAHFTGRAAVCFDMLEATQRTLVTDQGATDSLSRMANGYSARARRAHADLVALGWVEPLVEDAD